jgi:CheY-like chemotaxis protein
MVEGRRRILVVEDDSETAEQLVESLSTSGYQVDLAADGNEGRASLSAHSYDSWRRVLRPCSLLRPCDRPRSSWR